ncbi:MAG TPA: hypothetical protein PKA82_14700 [Pyrinomonadaceae bacterium]|nr:hypothetical protein [Pyrinomonadaceae bacterium]
MLRSKFFAVLFAVTFLLSLSGSALACACCAERGFRSLRVAALDEYQRGLLKDMKMEDTVNLYTDEAGFEMIRGLRDLEKEYNDGGLEKIDLVSSYLNNSWKITIKTPGGKTGTLTLPRPSVATMFKVDQFERTEGDAVLYKEFMFNGNVGSGTGAFKSGIVSPTKYSLVFMGKGNFCDNAEDFTNWRLEINGSKARYAFFGKMKA